MHWSKSSARPALKALAVGICASPAVAGDVAYVTCQSSDEVGVVDLAGGGMSEVWPTPGKPAGIALGSPGEVYTVAPEAKAVRRVDRTTGTVLAEVILEGGPTGIAFDGKRGRVFVSDWFSARLWVLEAADLKTIATLSTGTSPAGLALSEDGRYLASADKDSDQVSLFDAESLVILAQVPVGVRPYGLRFAPDGRLFVGNVGTNDVSVIDPASARVLGTVPVGDRPYGVAFAKGRAFVTNQYENTISVIDLYTLDPVTKINAGDYPEGIDTLPDGSGVAFVNWFDNTLTVIDAETLDVISELDTCDGPRAFGTFLALGGDG